MRSVTYGLFAALAVTSIAAAAQEPPAPESMPNPPAEAPAPASAPAPAPAEGTTPPPPVPQPPPAAEPGPAAPSDLSAVMIPGSLSGYRRPEQPSYGVVRRPEPAQDLAMAEMGMPVRRSDPRVELAAILLTEATAVYVEDAPRIAALTIAVARQLRAENQAVSPMQVLDAATRWRGPAGPRGNVPRRFAEFTRSYRAGRLAGKDHASVLSQMGVAVEAPAPAPGP